MGIPTITRHVSKDNLGAQLLREEIQRRGWGAVRGIARECLEKLNRKVDPGQLSRWANEGVLPDVPGRKALEELLKIGWKSWDEPPVVEGRTRRRAVSSQAKGAA